MTTTKWHLKGQYFESCNCDVLCPCIVQSASVRPTYGHCDVALAFHIDEGEIDGTTLAGLNLVAAHFTPGPMAAGNWTSAFYLDERANPQQREALERILSGKVGGPAERWTAMATSFMGIKYVPIEFKVEGRIHSVTIPNIMDFCVEPIMARGQNDALLLANTSHFANRDLYLAKGSRGSYTDHGMRWDNSGKNGHYASFDWRWP